MRIQKRKVNKKTVNNSMEMNNITGERFVELQAEAYYKAIKRIEDEKTKVDNVVEERKSSFWQDIKFVGNIIFLPRKAKEKYDLRNDMTNGIFSMFSSVIMWVIGCFVRLAILFVLLIDVCSVINNTMHISYAFVDFLICIFLAIIASMFILSSEEIAKERDRDRTMSYTSNILAMISVVLAIVALVVS